MVLFSKDIIASHKKFPEERLLKFDFKKASLSGGTLYATVLWKTTEGKWVPLYYKFQNQLLVSGAKLPPNTTEENAKKMQIGFATLTRENLDKSDYTAKQASALLKLNEPFIEALNIMADQYLLAVDEDLLGKRVMIGKIPVVFKTSTEVFVFRQVDRAPNPEGEPDDIKYNDDGRIDLEKPIYRFKLPTYFDSTEIGKSYGTKSSSPVVYDVSSKKKVEARWKNPETGKKEKLTIKNANHFITAMSAVTGALKMQLCKHKFGISMTSELDELLICPHRPIKGEIMTEEDVSDMGMFSTGYDQDVDMPADNENKSKETDVNSDKKSNKRTEKKIVPKKGEILLPSDDEEDEDDEPEETDIPV